MNKKAIELSINFLVIIIISLVMLSSGMVLVRKFFSVAEDIEQKIDSDTEKRIAQMLNEGRLIAITQSKDIKKGDGAIIWIGIINIKEPGEFRVDISLSSAYDIAKQPIQGLDPDEWLIYNPSFNLDTKEQKNLLVSIDVPNNAVSGTYIYNVNIESHPSYPPSKMYIIVP